MLLGSEEALQQMEVYDHSSHAAHLTRDLFQQLVEHLAPSKAVEQQPWFEPTPEAPGWVSRRSRLRYILYGSGALFDEEGTKLLDESADSAKVALDLCIARAYNHHPELEKSEVQLAIDQVRFALLEVLKKYRAR
jgi:hypothetical protein